MTKDKMTVETKSVSSIDYDTKKGVAFQDYSYNFLKTGLKDEVLPIVWKYEI